jgi:hypothetical protein
MTQVCFLFCLTLLQHSTYEVSTALLVQLTVEPTTTIFYTSSANTFTFSYIYIAYAGKHCDGKKISLKILTDLHVFCSSITKKWFLVLCLHVCGRGGYGGVSASTVKEKINLKILTFWHIYMYSAPLFKKRLFLVLCLYVCGGIPLSLSFSCVCTCLHA